ncbi:hypothetical protein [Polaromonas sp.]|uniref:hypothetical protein n=1 Tax=Polaromonas sp. TaxID=1869339 RepID=UPI00272FDBFA|nr:hypothetical protein [Polaromonas sp.]MDP1740091.1 hypothetical protein [Polaromonas sp.]
MTLKGMGRGQNPYAPHQDDAGAFFFEVSGQWRYVREIGLESRPDAHLADSSESTMATSKPSPAKTAAKKTASPSDKRAENLAALAQIEHEATYGDVRKAVADLARLISVAA